MHSGRGAGRMGLKLFVFAFVFVFVFSSMFLYVYLYSQEKWAPQCTGTGAGKKGLGGLTGGRSTESCITSIAPPFFTSQEPKIYCRVAKHQLLPPFYTSLEPKIYCKATIHQLLTCSYATSQCSIGEQWRGYRRHISTQSCTTSLPSTCTCTCTYYKRYQDELHSWITSIAATDRSHPTRCCISIAPIMQSTTGGF